MSHDEILFNSIKIIRTLILKSKIYKILLLIIYLFIYLFIIEKGYEEFLKKLTEFYSSILSDSNQEEDSIVYYKIFVEDMVLILDQKYEIINICIEIFLLLSYLTNQNEEFKKILEKSESFMNVLHKIINTYSVNYYFLLINYY
jgi:hypothetical protein